MAPLHSVVGGRPADGHPRPPAGEERTSDTAPVFRLVYRSRLTVPPRRRREEIGAIARVSRRNNADLGVTGALLIWQEYVVATVEGEEDVVLGLYAKIADDARHEAVTVLQAHHEVIRLFSRWSIARTPGPTAVPPSSDGSP